MPKTVKIAPSILSANFSELAVDIRQAEAGGADLIHIDVMDGHFVPNITIGPVVLTAIRNCTSLPFDVHLMIDEPDKYVEQFVDAGADIITVHAEVCKHLHRTIHHVIDCGAKVGVALNPYSPLSLLTDALPELNLLLIMTVNPGFGGQKFIKSVVPKISEARELLDNLGADDLNLEVDGGVSPDTAPLAVKAGADILVAGNSVFKGKGSIQENIQALRDSIAELISN